jgi:hypothetical protein
LEKFFDLVCHQRLTAKLAPRVGDRRLLVLIGRLLKAKVVLLDGVVIASDQGFSGRCSTTVASRGPATSRRAAGKGGARRSGMSRGWVGCGYQAPTGGRWA